jgi:hypothetical protein
VPKTSHNACHCEWVSIRELLSRQCATMHKNHKGNTTDLFRWVQPVGPSTVTQTVTLLIYSGDGHCDSRPLPRLSWGLTQFYSVLPVKFSCSVWNQATTVPCYILSSAVCHHPNHAASRDLRQLGPRWTRLTGAGEQRRLLSDLILRRSYQEPWDSRDVWHGLEKTGFWRDTWGNETPWKI